MTSYTVLRRIEPEPAEIVRTRGLAAAEPDRFELVRSIEAHSPTQAIRKVCENLPSDDVDGTYVAVPTRSWQPERVSLETPAPRLVVGFTGTPLEVPPDGSLSGTISGDGSGEALPEIDK